MDSSPEIAFVCCVESGFLEPQTVRMVESLRRFGGSMARAPLYAVTPRLGPPLSRATREAFDRLEVEYVFEPQKNRYSWFKFLNKPLAVVVAEQRSNAKSVCWLDSDLILLQEPELLRLSDDEDFAACASDKEMGTEGPGDTFEELWRANCRALGMDIDALPWVVTRREGARIRVYWNGGIFVYRRSTRFGEKYLKSCMDLMDARHVSRAPGYAIGINEMSAIGLAMHRYNLRYRELPITHNYSMNSRSHTKWYKEEDLREARILHYHDSMWPWFWDKFLECLAATHPDVERWLRPLGPMRNEAPLPSRLVGKVLRKVRDVQEKSYVKSCAVI